MQKKLVFMLMLLLGTSWVNAEELSVKVAGDRTAVFNVLDAEAGDPTLSGTIKGAANLKDGKSGLRADLVLKQAAELKGAQADVFANVTGKTIEAIGYLDMKVPADPTSPKVLDVDMETVTEGDQAAANLNVDFEGPTNGEAVPKGSGKGSFKGDFKAFKSTADFDFSGGTIKGSDIPFSKMDFSISEVVEGAIVKTTVAFTITAPKGGEMAGQMAGIPAMAKPMQDQLTQMGIKSEKVDFPAPTDVGETTVGKGTITLIDVRTTIKPYLGMAAAQMQGVPDAQKALEEMLEARLDKFGFSMEVGATSVKGNIVVDSSNLTKFWNGYLTLLPAINEMSNQEMLANAGPLKDILEPFLKLNTRQAVESFKLLSASAMAIEGNFNFTLDTKGEPGPAQTMAFKADGKVDATGYADFVKKAQAAGLAVATKAVGKLTLNLKDQTALTGQAYFFTDGDVVDYYKTMLAKAAAEAKAPADVQKAITDLSLTDAAFKLSLRDTKMTVLARSTTSDLTAIARMLIKQGAPQLDAEFSGGAVDVTLGEDGKGKSDVKFFFSNFLPGKDAAGVKEALGLPSTAKVTMDAPADQVKLIAVEQPEIAADGKLAEVQQDGQKLLATSPSEVADGGKAGGGGSKWGLIAIGVLLLAGVGGFLAFGKKSA